MSETIRVLLVDDHGVVRRGLGALLATYDDIEVVGDAGSGAEGVALAQRLLPDVVLMDLVMPGMDGIAATRQVKLASPTTQVIVLTSYSEDERIFPAIKAGKVVRDERDAWSEDALPAKEETAWLKKHDWDDYASWHLGVDPTDVRLPLVDRSEHLGPELVGDPGPDGGHPLGERQPSGHRVGTELLPDLSALREEFPRVEFSEQLFAIDRDRFTCTGGVAPLDLMLHLIREDLGREIVPLVQAEVARRDAERAKQATAPELVAV
mgnify:CR=1 FL=1